MSAGEAIVWGAVTTVVTGLLVFAGKQETKKARLVLRTPTTSAASAQGGDPIEIKGRVAAAEKTLTAPLSGREAVWTHVKIEEQNGSSWTTLVNEVQAVEFLVDDGSGRMARVVPAAREGAIAAWQCELGGEEECVDQAGVDSVVALMERTGVKDFDPKKLRWTERALCVGDPVYVLGPAEVVVGPPVTEGYRTKPSMEIVLRDTFESPLTIAASSEEAFVQVLHDRAATFFGSAAIAVVLGLIATIVALSGACDSGGN